MVDEDTEFLNVYYGKEIKKPQADMMLKHLKQSMRTMKSKFRLRKAVSRFTTILFPQNNIMELEYA